MGRGRAKHSFSTELKRPGKCKTGVRTQKQNKGEKKNLLADFIKDDANLQGEYPLNQ